MSELLYKCANAECDNQLTEYELKKLSQFKTSNLTRFNFCRTCRFVQSTINFINCSGCNRRIKFGQYNKTCDSCKKKKRNEHHREYLRSRRKSKAVSYQDQITYLLKTNKFATIGEIRSFIQYDISLGSLKTTIAGIRKKEKMKIKYRKGAYHVD